MVKSAFIVIVDAMVRVEEIGSQCWFQHVLQLEHTVGQIRLCVVSECSKEAHVASRELTISLYAVHSSQQ